MVIFMTTMSTASADNAEHVFHVVHSNDLDALSRITVRLMDIYQPKNPFEEQDVIIPNNGMREWLNTRIAKYASISMRIRYNLPWNYFWKLFNHLGMVEKSNPQERYRRENMVWNIFTVLPELINGEKTRDIFRILYDYLIQENDPAIVATHGKGENQDFFSKIFPSSSRRRSDENNSTSSHQKPSQLNESRLYQLSEVIANIFDGYILYRSDWLQSATTSQVSYPDIYRELLHFTSQGKGTNTSRKDVSTDMWKGIKPEDFAKYGDNDRTFVLNNIWQVVLWQRIVELNSKDFDPEERAGHLEGHLANMIERFIKLLPENPQMQEKLPKSLIIFGVSSLPPLFIKMLKCMSSCCKVFYLLPNPCQHYWGDIKSPQDDGSSQTFVDRMLSGLKRHSVDLTFSVTGEHNVNFTEKNYEETDGTLISGNSLLVSWGKQGRDTLYMLVENETTDTDLFIDPWIREDSGHSVLAAIQKDIFSLTERNIFDPKWVSDEVLSETVVWEKLKHNVQIHIAYTPMREVEKVHDYILHLFARDPALKPNDLVVMTPNINLYAPYIEAVFGISRNNPEENIPYTISDQTYERSSSFFTSFFNLLTLPHQSITGSFVLELLSAHSIASRFSIAQNDLNIIKTWINNACIRGDYSEKDLQPDSEDIVKIFSTWERSFDRMLIGSLLPPDSGLYAGDLYPYTAIGSDQIELLIRVKYFVDELGSLREKLRGYIRGKSSGLTVKDWKTFIIQEVLEKFYLINEESGMDEDEYDILREFMIELIEQFENLGPDRLLTLDVFAGYLKNKASNRSIFHPFMSGKVNFCSFVPMRSVPFRHIIMMGMNSGDFPRSDMNYDFDLLRRENGLYARKGDRSRHNDDRYMFLETVTAARDSLYISYIGRSAVDNSVLNPSSVVQELENYVAKTFILEEFNQERQDILARMKDQSRLSVENNCKLFQLYKDNSRKLLSFDSGAGFIFKDTLSSWDEKNFVIHSGQNREGENKEYLFQGDPYRSYQEYMCPLSPVPEIKCRQVIHRFISSQLASLRQTVKLRGIRWQDKIDKKGVEYRVLRDVIYSIIRCPVMKEDSSGNKNQLYMDVDIFVESGEYRTLRQKLSLVNNSVKSFLEHDLWQIMLQELPLLITDVIERQLTNNERLVIEALSVYNDFSTILTDQGVRKPENINEKAVLLTLSTDDLAAFVQDPVYCLYKNRFGISETYKGEYENDSDDNDPDQELLHSWFLDLNFSAKSEFDRAARKVRFTDETMEGFLRQVIKDNDYSPDSVNSCIQDFFQKLKYSGGLPANTTLEKDFKEKLAKKLVEYINDYTEISQLEKEGFKPEPQKLFIDLIIPRELLPKAYREIASRGAEIHVIIEDIVEGVYTRDGGQKEYRYIHHNHLNSVNKLKLFQYVNMLCLKTFFKDTIITCTYRDKENKKYLVGDNLNSKGARSLLVNLVSTYLFGMQHLLPFSLLSDYKISTTELDKFQKIIPSNFNQALENASGKPELIIDTLTGDVPGVPAYLLSDDSFFQVLKPVDGCQEISLENAKNDRKWKDLIVNFKALETRDFTKSKSEVTVNNKHDNVTLRDKFLGRDKSSLPLRRMFSAYYMLRIMPEIFSTDMKKLKANKK